jgi:hypothetical protein
VTWCLKARRVESKKYRGGNSRGWLVGWLFGWLGKLLLVLINTVSLVSGPIGTHDYIFALSKAYMFWNGAFSSMKVGIWLLLVTPPQLHNACVYTHPHTPLNLLTHSGPADPNSRGQSVGWSVAAQLVLVLSPMGFMTKFQCLTILGVMQLPRFNKEVTWSVG